ncbi:hypothetical protein U1872_15015 [Sphingomonas sp. RB3P16]
MMLTSREVGKSPSAFCKDDIWGICQATTAVLALFGTLWSIGLLF